MYFQSLIIESILGAANKKDNISDHLNDIKAKTEGAYQTIISLLHNKEYNNIEMTTIWKLVETCIIPNITYGCEVWTLRKKEKKSLNSILDNILKRILKVPQGTPREVLYIETNLLDIERIIEKKRLSMLYRISKNENRMNKLILNENSEWTKETKKIIDKYEINKQRYLNMKPRKAKKFIRIRIQLIFRKELFENRDNKSKVDYQTKQ